MADTLTITGLGRHFDGDYEFDIADLIGIGRPAMLTGHEAHTLKMGYGVLVGQLERGLLDGDWDAYLGIGAVVLGRNGKRVTVDQMRGLPVAGVSIDFEPRKIDADDLAEDDADPPPQVAPTPPENGGASGKPTSAPLASDPSRIGPPGSPRSATSDPLTLAS